MVGLGSVLKKQAKKAALKIQYTTTATVAVNPQSLREGRVLLAEGIETVGDSYKVLRTHVLQKMRANSWKTLAITSPWGGNGKTTTAINLAISLARDVNQTVLLVDFDLKRPSIANFFRKSQAVGVSDYLINDIDLADILINPGIERLVVLPGNERIIHSSEILSSPRVIQLVAELKSRYEDRLILFDMPPLFAGDDVLAFLPNVDAVMLVVEDGKVTAEELARAEQLLGQKCIGISLNKTRMHHTAVGHY